VTTVAQPADASGDRPEVVSQLRAPANRLTPDGILRPQAASGRAPAGLLKRLRAIGAELVRIPVAKSPSIVVRGDVRIPLAKSPVTRAMLAFRMPVAKSPRA
jgi:hypothetical protein